MLEMIDLMAPFDEAHRAIDAHDPDALQAVLTAHPEVLGQTGGTNANDLLGMATATCDERTVAMLLEAGASPTQANVHGWAALHQAGYADAAHLVPMLLDAGADPGLSARGDGGTPFIVAAFWGRRAVMELLPALPHNLRAGASAGDLAVLGSPEAGAHRAYYRPHSGFPEWAPSDDPQQVLDEALAWAARNDRAAVLAPLVKAGARLGADVYRGTALIWAAATGAAAAVGELLALGAEVDGRGGFGGETHGRDVTPLHIAAEAGNEEIVDLLLEAGADSTLRDGQHGGAADGWAEHGGHPQLAERIRATRL